MDSMLEIFYEEGYVLVNEMRSVLDEYKGKDCYGMEFIKHIFRGVHTLKANSTMMLFDAMSSLSRTLESLLYFFVNNNVPIHDTEHFSQIFTDYLDYIESQLDMIAEEQSPVREHSELEKQIKGYLFELTSEHKKKDVSQEAEEDAIIEKYSADMAAKYNHTERKVYYIPGVPDEQRKHVSQFHKSDSESMVLVNRSDIQKIYDCIDRYTHILAGYEKRFENEIHIDVYHKDFVILRNMRAQLIAALDNMTKTNFVAVVRKMEILVDEMSESLQKPVKLLSTGENVVVDKVIRDKISSALVHVIRNAVDHGIESFEERERLGKSPMGLIRLEFVKEDDKFMITVEDDGAGIDREAVLRSAQKNGLLSKVAKDYSDDEVLELILLSGVSTTKKPNDYSGRGVGMDAIIHNVKSLGGKLNIKSKQGLGTKVEMIFEGMTGDLL